MYNWDDDGYQLHIYSDNAGRHKLIDWCQQQFGECDWQAMGDYDDDSMSTVYRFKSLEDAMGFKLRGEE